MSSKSSACAAVPFASAALAALARHGVPTIAHGPLPSAAATRATILAAGSGAPASAAPIVSRKARAAAARASAGGSAAIANSPSAIAADRGVTRVRRRAPPPPGCRWLP